MSEIFGRTTTTSLAPNVFSGGEDIVVDQTFDPNSENAQSGVAVAEAVAYKPTLYSGEELTRNMISEPNTQYIRKVANKSEADSVFWKAKLGDIYINPSQAIAFICTKQFRMSYPTGNPPETWNANNETLWDILELPYIDQTYRSNSSNAQSGKAVAEAIDGAIGDIETALDEIIALQNSIIGGE